MSVPTDMQENYIPDDDEQYEPGETMLSLDTSIRMTAASIAVKIPWNPSEPVTNAAIRSRFELVYEWLKDGVDKDLE